MTPHLKTRKNPDKLSDNTSKNQEKRKRTKLKRKSLIYSEKLEDEIPIKSFELNQYKDVIMPH